MEIEVGRKVLEANDRIAEANRRAFDGLGAFVNDLGGRVIGVAFDGTGYGADGAIWGGEFLLADYASFERGGHLAYVPMPGAAQAIREPFRMALAHLDAVPRAASMRARSVRRRRSSTRSNDRSLTR